MRKFQGRENPGSQVAVYLAGTQTPAQIVANPVYQQAKANPFTSPDGHWSFWADETNRYDIQITAGPGSGAITRLEVLQSYLRGGLPDPIAGRLARAADSVRGILLSTGEQWVDLGREVINVRLFGALGDTRKLTDVQMVAGSPILTSASAGFSPADLGKRATVAGAGGTTLFGDEDAATVALLLDATVEEVISATEIRLSQPSSQNVENAYAYIGTDDTGALNGACARVGETSCVVYAPPGFYYVRSEVVVPSFAQIVGAGMRTLFLQAKGGFGRVFNADGTQGVQFRNLAIDVCADTDHVKGISLQFASDCAVENCHIFNGLIGSRTNEPGSWTIHGILYRNTTRCRIDRNYMLGTQIVGDVNSAGTVAVQDLFIRENISVFARRFGMSMAASGNGPLRIQNVNFLDNIIIQPLNGAFLGPGADGGSWSGHIHKQIRVCGNIVLGPKLNRSSSNAYIKLDLNDGAEDCEVSGNVVDGVDTGIGNVQGIIINMNSGRSAGVRVFGNGVRNVNHYGISLVGTRGSVANNCVENTRGMRLMRCSGPCHGNQIRNILGSRSVQLLFINAEDVLVFGNVIEGINAPIPLNSGLIYFESTDATTVTAGQVYGNFVRGSAEYGIAIQDNPAGAVDLDFALNKILDAAKGAYRNIVPQ